MKKGQAEKSISAICRTCAENSLTTPCRHSVDERSFISVWTLDELAYAVTALEHEILDIYEAYVYTESEVIFKDFLETLAKYKVQRHLFIIKCQFIILVSILRLCTRGSRPIV